MESPCSQCDRDKKAEDLCTAVQLLKDLLANMPDTYSGTNIESNQQRMFNFAHTASLAQEFINEHI